MTDRPMVHYLDPPPTPRALTAPPAAGRVVVVAPHPDDELIGAGGTILLHRTQGDPVHVVVLTSGAGGGDPEVRAAETRAACERLGVESVTFLGFPDGARAREEDLGAVVPALSARLAESGAQVVYTPHLGECHGDHHVTAVAAQRAVAAAGAGVRCFGYEIWTPLTADVVVDVSAVMDEKLAIGALYQSQLRDTDILHFFRGLNAYRAVYLPKGARFGEAFCDMTPDPAR